MQTVSEKLQYLLDKKGVTAYEAAARSGVSEATLSRILKKGTKLSLNTKQSLANYFQVDLDYFNEVGTDIRVSTPEIVRDDEPFENKNGNKFQELPNGQYVMTMPIIEVNAQAGLLDNYQSAEFLLDMEQYGLVTDQPVKGRYIAFRVSGHSMDDGGYNAIPDKSIVSTRELQRHHWTSKIRYSDFPYWVIYTTQSKMPLLKEIIEHNAQEGYITCHSLNDSPEFTDFRLDINDVQALFYVIEVKRNVTKKISY